MLTREEFDKIYAQGPEACYQLFQQLFAQIELLLSQNKQLAERVQQLEAKQAKDSHNSHKPPSTDLHKPKPKSLRKHSSRKQGGQKGHPGHHLALSDSPDHLQIHSVQHCASCSVSLSSQEPDLLERRQVFELPPLRLEVTEHQAEHKICHSCGYKNIASFPQEISAPVQYGPYLKSFATYLYDYQFVPFDRMTQFFEEVFHQSLSTGFLVEVEEESFEKLEESEKQIKNRLSEADVLNSDETGMRFGGKRNWCHNASTEKLTAYFPHESRGKEAMDAFGILPNFKGRLIHDHLKAYFLYLLCKHGLCNVHHLRELVFQEEHHGQKWARKMIDFLLEVNAKVDEERNRSPALSKEVLKKYENRYQKILKEGFQENPLREKVEGKRGRTGQNKGRNLVRRLRDFKEAVLAFMYDFRVPFGNNQAEQDIRMVKVQQKISGTFRSRRGAERFCRIRGYISTVHKHGLNILESLRNAFLGNPFIPYANNC